MTAQSFSSNTGITALPEVDSVRNPDVYIDNLKLRNGIKILQSVIDLYTGALGEDPAYWNQQSNPANWTRLQNLTRVYAVTSEAIALGATVNFYDVAGVLTARNANATATGKPCHAFCNKAVGAGAYGEFIQEGTCFYVGGLTAGVTYYQSNTNGLISAGAGTIVQRIGYALGPSTLSFRPTLV